MITIRWWLQLDQYCYRGLAAVALEAQQRGVCAGVQIQPAARNRQSRESKEMRIDGRWCGPVREFDGPCLTS
ncbi:MAG: hypothetical protein ABR512_08610 [Desulfopila sp.]